jgi:phosphoserine phosphatase
MAAEGAPVRLAFVDVDGTLLNCSSERLFLAHLLRTGSLGFRSLLSFALGYAFHPSRTASLGPGWNRRYLSGLDPEALRAAGERFSLSILLPRIRPEVRSLLASLSEEGFSLVLLSASLLWLVDPLRKSVGAREAICSVPGIERGALTGEISGPRPWGPFKVDLAERAAVSAGASLASCCALGNSSSDIALLSACGTAFAVHPSPALRKAAAGKCWKIIEGR